MNHVTGLIDRGLNVTVLANSEDVHAWSSLEDYQRVLRDKVFYYRLPKSRRARITGGVEKLLHGIVRGDRKALSTMNYNRYGRSAINFSLLYAYSLAKTMPKIDVLHCHFGPIGTLGAHLKRMGVVDKLVVTFHGHDVSRALVSSESNPYEAVFEQADLILPISDRWYSALSKLGAPSDRMCVHRVGIDVSRFRFKARTGTPGFLHILTTARFTEKKGIRYAVEAVAKALERQPDLSIQYDIVGEGELFKEIRELIDILGLTASIKLHGARSHSEVRSLLGEADIFLLPSVTATDGDQEGIPVALMEAMAVGMPVVTTEHSGIPELVEDGVSGYLSPEKDSDSLAESILTLSQNPDSWQRLGAAGRERVEKYFSLEVQNNKLIELYRTL
ncbi:glycosyltransferase [Marinobacter aromaticivorans]|uniref:Glycosyltransferase n=1 Tax=Marinobacter aromaticivorans TaxID=1494078 RepID=A0ABW2ISA4_9GAMM|nr:glycosyltransferase [Marinobacter aromaticivorans]